MEDRHKRHISGILLQPINQVIHTYIFEKYGSQYVKTIRTLVKAVKKFKNLNSSGFVVDLSELKKTEEQISIPNMFIAGKLLRMGPISINLAEEEFIPFKLLKNSNLSTDSLSLLKYSFAFTTYHQVQLYLKENFNKEYRSSLEAFFYEVQEKNPTYFKWMGFRESQVGNFPLGTIEKKLERLIKEFQIDNSHYLDFSEEEQSQTK